MWPLFQQHISDCFWWNLFTWRCSLSLLWFGVTAPTARHPSNTGHVYIPLAEGARVTQIKTAPTAGSSCPRQLVWCPPVAHVWRSLPNRPLRGGVSRDWNLCYPYWCPPLGPVCSSGQMDHHGCIYLRAERNVMLLIEMLTKYEIKIRQK